MNRESSRSHLVMSVIIEATNLQTQNVTKGKLSFVDLAGSERCAPAQPAGQSRFHVPYKSMQRASALYHCPRECNAMSNAQCNAQSQKNVFKYSNV